jgi:hypothetical protein
MIRKLPLFKKISFTFLKRLNDKSKIFKLYSGKNENGLMYFIRLKLRLKYVNLVYSLIFYRRFSYLLKHILFEKIHKN